MKGLLFALVLSVCVAELLAGNCYLCSYSTLTPGSDSSCMDPFNTAILQSTCEGDKCIKIKSSLNGEVIGLSRSCASPPLCLSSGCTNIAGIETCCCSGDKCNGATSVTFGLVTMGLSVLIGGMTAAW